MTKDRENEIRQSTGQEELLSELRTKIQPQASAPYQTTPIPMRDAREVAEISEEMDFLEKLLSGSGQL